MDWVLFILVGWVREWRLLESGFAGLYGFTGLDSRFRGNDGVDAGNDREGSGGMSVTDMDVYG